MEHRTLSDLENRILDFAERFDVAHLETVTAAPALAAEFGWRPVTYLQRLFALIDDPAAEAAQPMEVRRLQRLRAERRQRRIQQFSTAV